MNTQNTAPTFVTGNPYSGLRRWAKVGSTEKTATFCLLQWSEDYIKEPGVMRFTNQTVRVHLNKHGFYFKKTFGMFREDTAATITIRP